MSDISLRTIRPHCENCFDKELLSTQHSFLYLEVLDFQHI